jgi:RNA polymerase sigma-70 factor (ECF subfamily)
MEWAEQAVVERARSGDGEAFRELVERHSRPLFRLAYRMTGSESDAEDVVQETFLKAYRQLARFDGRASFGTWLHRIATNCALDIVRARRRRGEQFSEPSASAGDVRSFTDDLVDSAPSSEPAPDRLAMGGETRRRVAEAMNDLSPVERAAFVMRHFEGVSMEEIGHVLGCQTGAAKHSVFRAIQKLRRALEPLVGTTK